MLLFIILVVLLSIPSVQTYVAQKVTNNLNEKYNTDININKIGLKWNGEVEMEGVYIADHHKDTLIYSPILKTNIVSFRNLIKAELAFNYIDLQDAKLYVNTYPGETTDNLNVFSNKFAPETPDPDSQFLLGSSTVNLTNAHVRITNQNLENPELLDLKKINLQANKFKVLNSDVFADVQTLNFIYNNDLVVENLTADFSYTTTGMDFKSLDLIAGGSILRGDLKMLYGENGLSNFQDEVVIEADLTEVSVSTNDLNVFYNEFGKDQKVDLTGSMRGTLNNFFVNDLQLTNQGTTIRGDFSFLNLLKGTNEYSVNAKNHQIATNYYDLRRFMPNLLGSVLPIEIESLGKFTFFGNTLITGTNLDTESRITSSIGTVEANLKMGSINNLNNVTYQGTIDLANFNLGKMYNNKSLGKTTARVRVKGRGFTQETVNTEISGRIRSLGFNDYNYTNIQVSGNLQDPIFNGNLSIDDPNLKLKFEGLVDVTEAQNNYDFSATVQYADLYKIKLVERDSISIFTGSVEMQMAGTTVDDVEGTIRFYESTYQNQNDDYYFDDILVISSFEADERTIEVVSQDIVAGEASGKFLLADLPSLFQNSVASIYTNYVPQRTTTDQYINFNFEVFNKIVEVFVPEIKFADNTFIRGSVASNESEFKLNFRTPEITAFGNHLERVNLQVDNNNPLFNTYIEIKSIDAGFYNISDFNLINVTLQDTLFFRTEFNGGPVNEDVFNLSLYHTINTQGKSVVGMKRSDIVFKENKWFINEANDTLNKVVFDNNFKDIIIDSLVLSHNDEIIQMAGFLSRDDFKDIKLQFKDVDIGKITPQIDSLEVYGNVNGTLNLLQRDGAYYPNSSVTIDNLIVNDNELGDLVLQISGNEDLTSYQINTTLTNQDVRSLTAMGEINVSAVNSYIDLNVGLNDFNLAAFSPFGGDVITDIRGLASGNARVSGNYKSPDMNGRLALDDAGIKIPYLNVDMKFRDQTLINLTKNRFTIPLTTVTDSKYNTTANVSGFFEHDNFSKWMMSLDINTDRFLVLDTEGDEESLYYGTAFINGNALIAGPIDELVIDVTATTARGTSFKIPISDTESIGEDYFIYFISPEEKAARVSGDTFIREELKGLSLNFDLDITRDAEVEVVVDIKNNSTLTGRGEGTLLIEINTLGRFNMWGDFQVYEANYDFRYAGLVQKQFQVERGGNISWDGRPERARLDIKATYETEANPSVLLDNTSINRKIPVDVSIILQGELIAPNFDYEIKFPTVSSIVRSELDYKLDDRQQRELQVLYLITTGSFSSDYFTVEQGTATVVERFSSLVNEIFADQDGKFRVGLDYSQGTRTPVVETSDRVGVTLSTQISERVLINGRVGVPVGGVTENTIAGDFEIQILLNEDGTFRLKFFNRETEIQFIGENQGYAQGGGISYAIDFDTFKEFTNLLFKDKVEIELESESEPRNEREERRVMGVLRTESVIDEE